MNLLQGILDFTVEEYTSSKNILRILVRNKYQKLGVKLDESQINEIAEKLLETKDGKLDIDFDLRDDQFTGPRIDLNSLDIEFDDSDFDEARESFRSKFEEFLPAVTDDTANEIFKDLKRRSRSKLAKDARYRRKFEERLKRRWRKPFESLELLISLALEAGSDFNTQYRNEAAKTNDFVFDALTRLHARACQVASEVLVLLKAGFADGAHARWRTLHEIAVVAFFIKNHGNSVAERYLLHSIIESYRGAIQFQKYAAAINYKPLPEKEMDEIKNEFDEAIKKFGTSYGGPYGWAADALNSKKPNFADIEENAGLDHFRPYYKMASHNVHANPKGIYFKLGLSRGHKKVLLAGPSDEGLADPLHGVALALYQITSVLLLYKPNIDNLVLTNILRRYEQKIREEILG